MKLILWVSKKFWFIIVVMKMTTLVMGQILRANQEVVLAIGINTRTEEQENAMDKNEIAKEAERTKNT